MAQAQITVQEFKGGYAVVDAKGANPIRDDEGRPTGFGEVLTRTETKAEADEYVQRLKAGKHAIRPAEVPGKEG